MTGAGHDFNAIYVFDRFQLDPGRRVLYSAGARIPLAPKAFDLLLLLVRNAPKVLETNELMQALWPATYVEESNLTQNIFLIRKALGEVASDHKYVVTIPRRGYSFVCPVKQSSQSRGAAAGVPARSIGLPAVSRKIVVFPFQALTDGPNDASLTQGLAEILGDRLSTIDGLTVCASPTPAGDEQLRENPLPIARSLGVDFALCGSVQRSSDRVRLNVRVLSVRDGAVTWAHQEEVSVTDIFGFQDVVVDTVSIALRAKLEGKEEEQTAAWSTRSTDAYLSYIRGRYFWNKRTPQGFRMAIRCFERACQQDSGYALAYAGLADTNSLLGCYNLTSPVEAWTRARTALQRALEIDDRLAEAHAMLALVLMGSEWAWPEAELECRRALSFNPNYAFALDCYAECLSCTQRHAEAIVMIKRAQQLEPLSLIINCDVGWNLFRARRYQESVDQLRHTVEMDPSFALARWALGCAYDAVGMHEEARLEFEAAMSLFDNGTLMLSSLGCALASGGHIREAHEILDQLLFLKRVGEHYVSSYDLALLCIRLGDFATAVHWLEQALDERPFELVYLKVDPRLDPLRPDARFSRLLQRVGLAGVFETASELPTAEILGQDLALRRVH